MPGRFGDGVRATQVEDNATRVTIRELMTDLAEAEHTLRRDGEDESAPATVALVERERVIVAELRRRKAPFTGDRLHIGLDVWELAAAGRDSGLYAGEPRKDCHD